MLINVNFINFTYIVYNIIFIHTSQKYKFKVYKINKKSIEKLYYIPTV